MIWYKNIFKKHQRLFKIFFFFFQLEIDDISVTLHRNAMKIGFVLFVSFSEVRGKYFYLILKMKILESFI